MSKVAAETSTLQVPTTERSNSAVSANSDSSSTTSNKSTLSRIANRFRFPDLRATARSKNDSITTENLKQMLDLQASFDKEGREKMGGGAAGARGVGH